jgi:hypothetical protein
MPAARDGGGAGCGRLASETRSTPRVVCECEVAGEPPAIDPPPVIAERIGVDVDPIDVRDPRGGTLAAGLHVAGRGRPRRAPAPRSSSRGATRRS